MKVDVYDGKGTLRQSRVFPTSYLAFAFMQWAIENGCIVDW
jgi:hypothetical protein